MAETVAGRKPVLETLKAQRGIERILLLEGIHGSSIEEIRALAARRNVPVEEVDRHGFRKIAGHQMTQGVIAILSRPFAYATLDAITEHARARGERLFIVLLDEIEDPHNLGALIRSAECAGAHGVVVPKHRSAPVNATVMKTAAGATEYIPIAQVTNLVAAIEELKKENCWVVGLDAGGTKLYNEVDYTTPLALVVGNEGKGIRRLVKEHCDFLVRIPLRGKIESLNASVAGAVVMYEVVRQRVASPP